MAFSTKKRRWPRSHPIAASRSTACRRRWRPALRSQTVVAAAARRDIALTPSTTFAVSPGHAPNAVRLALGAPSTEQLDLALRTLSGMLTAKEDVDTTE